VILPLCGCPGVSWTAAKAFREADKVKVRYLLDDEITRLVNACPLDFRALVTDALLTGCRYGELAAMKSGDFDPQSGTVTIGRSKSGKPRHVALTDEGRTFFDQMTAGKTGAARLFERDAVMKQATRGARAETARVAWSKSDQFRLGDPAARLMHRAAKRKTLFIIIRETGGREACLLSPGTRDVVASYARAIGRSSTIALRWTPSAAAASQPNARPAPGFAPLTNSNGVPVGR
jgi:hypothetical protein